ncbi:MAG TPA: hypothetical protein VGN52_14260 [Burkholderiales bacterium]|jgi:hypothetical protein
MRVSAELALMGLVVALHLYDSALLLYVNEGVLSPKGRRGWMVAFGSDKLQLRGREAYLPSPLRLHRPQYRLAWRFEDGAVDQRWAPDARLFRPLAPLVWGMALALFVLLPLGLFTSLGHAALLAALLLLYGSMAAALAWLWLKRKRLRIAARALAALSFECLTCAPFALNLVRHLSARMPADEDLECAARRLQQPADWARTRRRMIARLEEELEAEEPESERALRLKAHRERLAREEGGDVG